MSEQPTNQHRNRCKLDFGSPRKANPSYADRLKILAVDDDGLMLVNTAALLEDVAMTFLKPVREKKCSRSFANIPISIF